MKPMEAYGIISRCMNELMHLRSAYFPPGKGYSKEEITAQIIVFDALRRMEQEEDHG